MDSQIKLCWTTHQGTIMSVFDALLASESLVDVTLACDGQHIRAHKVILSACSPYFQDLINVDMMKHPVFFLKDVKFTELKGLIQYMYRGEVSIPQQELRSFLEVAQALRIRGLADIETDTNSNSSDTNNLPNHSTKNRITVPILPNHGGKDGRNMTTITPPTARVALVASPIAVVPAPRVLRSANVQVPRNIQKVQAQNTFDSSSSVSATVTTPPTPAKKRRIETRQSQTSEYTVQIPLLDVDSPITVVSSVVDPLQTASIPSTSFQYGASDHPTSFQAKDFPHRRTFEEMDAFGTEIKLEGTGGSLISLEEEENSMSQSSFSERWQQKGNGDNQMPDDGDVPGGSGNHNEGTNQIISPCDVNRLESFGDFVNVFKVFQKLVLAKQETFLVELEDTKKLVQSLVVPDSGLHPRNFAYGILPLKDEEELFHAESTIDDNSQYILLVEELKRVGGSTISKAVANTIRALLSADLAKNIRLTDSSGKISFGNLKLCKAVRDAVRTHFDPKRATDSVLNTCIGQSLRNKTERKLGTSMNPQGTPGTQENEDIGTGDQTGGITN